MNLQQYKELIEQRLDIKGTLTIEGDKIVPSKELTKKVIKTMMIDDLFQFHNSKVVFTNRLMSFVGEITDRKILTGHYHMELRK